VRPLLVRIGGPLTTQSATLESTGALTVLASLRPPDEPPPKRFVRPPLRGGLGGRNDPVTRGTAGRVSGCGCSPRPGGRCTAAPT